MQVCPECGTQYEDHVPTCIADGVRLVAVEATPEPPRKRTPPPPALAPSRERSALPLLLLLPLGGLVVAAGALVLGVALLQMPKTPEAKPPAPAPAIVAAPVPVEVQPASAETPSIDVVLVSIPEGAGVYENDQFVCETPCTVQHPPHAPLPRFFVFKLSGHRDETYEMVEAKGPIAIQMKRQKGAPAPVPAVAAPRPTIGRDR